MGAKAIKLGSWEGNVDLHELLKHEYKEKNTSVKLHMVHLFPRDRIGALSWVFFVSGPKLC